MHKSAISNKGFGADFLRLSGVISHVRFFYWPAAESLADARGMQGAERKGSAKPRLKITALIY